MDVDEKVISEIVSRYESLEDAQVECRGQEKVLINMYVNE